MAEQEKGKVPVTTVYVPDLEIPLPSREDLLRAACARVLDGDECGDIRLDALKLCCRMMSAS